MGLREVGAFEAKNELGTLLDWVASGEEVLITRPGRRRVACSYVNLAFPLR